MSDCGYECHIIGGPWISSNPDCPIHGCGAKEEPMTQVYMVVNKLDSYIRQPFYSLEISEAAAKARVALLQSKLDKSYHKFIWYVPVELSTPYGLE